MSRGSYFELLKETGKIRVDNQGQTENKITKDDLKNLGYDPKELEGILVNGDGINDLEPRSRFSRKDGDQWGKLLDTKTGVMFDSVLHLEFNSMFSSLREHYEETERLSSYSGENVHVISKGEAEEMLKAIDYILLGKYDVDFERILGKTFVEIFGDYDKDYSMWRYRRMFPDDKEYTGNDLEDTKDSLREIRTMLSAYLIAVGDPFEENRKEYLLTYTIWG